MFAIRFAVVRSFCSQFDSKKDLFSCTKKDKFWWSFAKTLKEVFKTVFNGVSTDLNWSFITWLWNAISKLQSMVFAF